MYWRLGGNIINHNALIVLVEDICWYIAINNPRKKSLCCHA